MPQMEEKIRKKPGRKPGTKNRPKLYHEDNKSLLLDKLTESKGIVAPAVKAVGVSRELYNRYYEEDPEFRLRVMEIKEAAIDHVESRLLKQIDDGGAAQTIFYLKTIGKNRGYVEETNMNMNIEQIRIKYTLPDGTPIPIESFNEYNELGNG